MPNVVFPSTIHGFSTLGASGLGAPRSVRSAMGRGCPKRPEFHPQDATWTLDIWVGRARRRGLPELEAGRRIAPDREERPMSEEPDRLADDQESQESADEGPVVDGRESACEVAEELKEQEERIEEGG